MRDLQAFTRFAADRHPGLPIFYHGHSFGTIVALQTAHEEQKARSPYAPKGVILQSLAMPFLIEKENAVAGALVATFGDVSFPHLTLIELFHGQPTGSLVLNCQWLRSSDRLGSGYKVRYLEQAAKLGHAARAAAIRDAKPVHILPVLPYEQTPIRVLQLRRAEF